MPPFKYPGPICQTKDWYDDIEDGTLVRTLSPLPSSVGSAAPQGAAKSPDSAADAGDGGVTFFPMGKAQSQNNFDNRLMHESGHNYQGSLWKQTGAGPWETAAKADDRRPSPYAARDYGEDFCEFIVLYNTAKGTSC